MLRIESVNAPVTIFMAGTCWAKQIGGLTMTNANASAPGLLTFAEIKEFASFSAASQRYIRRSLDVAFDRKDAIELWSRDVVEAASILFRPLTSGRAA
jgi:hypothetical protein